MTIMPQTGASTQSAGVQGFLWRAGGFLCLWLIVSGAAAADLPMGVAAAATAAWVSIILLPPGRGRPRLIALGMVALRFSVQSIFAGADVARRALTPRLPLRPGFIVYPVRSPHGPARDAFALLTGSLPGTIPIPSDESGPFAVHCLDVDQPIEEQLSVEETLLQKALGVESDHD
jgi:multicomponent Na+:H+ antiporter subunit E